MCHRYGQGKEVQGWPEVVHPGKDCRISPTRHGCMVRTAMAIERGIEDA